MHSSTPAMPNVLITGGGGQLASALQGRLGSRAVVLPRAELDITAPEQIASILDRIAVDVVINAAAYNAVDRAESEPEVAYRVNALGPRALALACAERRLTLVHVSTDYVFGQVNQHAPWDEESLPGPVSAYGVSKLAGEHFVRSLCPRHWVLRTCGLYGTTIAAPRKKNFVDSMLELANARDEIRVVDDQRCSPTSVEDLSEWIVELLQVEQSSPAYGLYHATNSGACTWAEFAKEIFRIAGLSTHVIPITSAEYPQIARRPAFSTLDNRKLAALLGIEIRDWQTSLVEYLQQHPLLSENT